ncbi:MAG: glutamine synthetase type III, partial [Lachnospiraceae bacterium]|nr:glutamine synthetase type III [Lachnospiraceae bacterium]
LKCEYETKLVGKLSVLVNEIADKTEELDAALLKVQEAEDIVEEGYLIRDHLLPVMSELRVPCDKAELLTAKSYWPFPAYEDLLFGVK